MRIKEERSYSFDSSLCVDYYIPPSLESCVSNELIPTIYDDSDDLSDNDEVNANEIMERGGIPPQPPPPPPQPTRGGILTPPPPPPSPPPSNPCD